MSKFKYYFRILKLYILNRHITLSDISKSYDTISSENQMLDSSLIHSSCIPMLDEIITKVQSNKDMESNKTINILDLGCGYGFNSNYLYSKLSYGNFTLVDISKNTIIKAKDFCDFNCNFVESDMLSFLNNCPHNSFDIIVCSYAIGYDSPKEIIKECSRVLKYRGYLGVIDNLKCSFPQIKKVVSKAKYNNSRLITKVPLKLNLYHNDYFFEKAFVDNKFNRLNLKTVTSTINFANTASLYDFVSTSGIIPPLSLSLNTDHCDVKTSFLALLNHNNIKSLTHNYIWGAFRNDK